MEKAIQEKECSGDLAIQPALGFLGVGWIGRNRMEAIAREGSCTVSAVCDTDENCVSEALKSATGACTADSFEEILNNDDIEGVVIATPSALHASQSIEALRKGKAVFCQKPLGRTAAETREVVEAAREADKLLAVDLSYRHTKAVRALYDLIQSKELGHIFSVDLVFHNAYGPDKGWFYDPAKSGGGCLIDLGVHLVDLALWSLGFPKVYHTTSRMFSKGQLITSSVHNTVEDFVTAKLDLEDNTVVNLSCSWNLPAGQDAVIEATFYGTKGAVSFKNIGGSFYDFVTKRFTGTKTETLVSPPDNWMGRAAAEWANRVARGEKYSAEAEELVKVAEVLDRLYGR